MGQRERYGASMPQPIFTLDQQQVRKFRDALAVMRAKAVPFAVRDSLNTMAFEARKVWQEQLRTKMTLRNHWTLGSIRIEKATGIAVETMQSRIGSGLDYLAFQESGGVEHGKGRYGKAIPTSTAAGQGKKSPRTKQVQKKNWRAAIHLASKRISYGNRSYRNQVAIAEALKGSGFVFLDLGRRKGIFRLSGTKAGSLRIRMIWDMSRKSVTSKPRPTLEPTVKLIELRATEIQRAAIQKQFDRIKR
jgi:hypothetical protein